jgi:hypothetical protein
MNISTSAFAPYVGGPGLQITVNGGTILCSNISTTLPTTTVQLTANATNYVYISILLPLKGTTSPQPAPTITTNTTGPDGIPLCMVVTSLTGIMSISDTRPDIVIY